MNYKLFFPKKIINLGVVVSVLALFSSCSCQHYYYSPEEAHSLKLSEKNDVKAVIPIGGTYQLGYSPIKHLGVQGSYFRKKRINEDPSFDPDASTVLTTTPPPLHECGFMMSSTSVGVGGYYPFSTGNSNISTKFDIDWFQGFLIDGYAGIGWGITNNEYIWGGFSDIKFRKYYQQLGIHYTNQILEISYILRHTQLNYYQIKASGKIPPRHFDDLEILAERNPYQLWQSTLKISLGTNYYSYFISLNGVHNTEDASFDFFQTINPHIGVVFGIDEFFRKRNRNKKGED